MGWRLRYLDLNFFDNNTVKTPKSNENVALQLCLFCAKLRPVNCDKRKPSLDHYGAANGGAALASARGALRAGVGLLTCGVKIFACLFCCLPRGNVDPLQSRNGGLALKDWVQLDSFSTVLTLVAGPGIGNGDESHALLREACKLFPKSILLDVMP